MGSMSIVSEVFLRHELELALTVRRHLEPREF